MFKTMVGFLDFSGEVNDGRIRATARGKTSSGLITNYKELHNEVLSILYGENKFQFESLALIDRLAKIISVDTAAYICYFQIMLYCISSDNWSNSLSILGNSKYWDHPDLPCAQPREPVGSSMSCAERFDLKQRLQLAAHGRTNPTTATKSGEQFSGNEPSNNTYDLCSGFG
jgi:hypothetical protein